jgi:hypothetical protein
MYARDKDQSANKLNRLQKNRGPSHIFALLYVCRQIFNESRRLPFSLNDFSFDGTLSLRKWYDLLRLQIDEIRCIRLYASESHLWASGQALDLLRGYPKVRTIEVLEARRGNWERRSLGQLDFVPRAFGGAELEEKVAKEKAWAALIREKMGEGVEVRFLLKPEIGRESTMCM